jgi:hypothetical protein
LLPNSKILGVTGWHQSVSRAVKVSEISDEMIRRGMNRYGRLRISRPVP